MSKAKRYTWEFSFDLDTHKLRQVYPGSSPANSYRMIRNYMFRNGFSNNVKKQGSCYFTLKPISKYDAARIICDLYVQFPWLKYCTRKSELSIVPKSIVNIDAYISGLIQTDQANGIDITNLPLRIDQTQEKNIPNKPKSL